MKEGGREGGKEGRREGEKEGEREGGGEGEEDRSLGSVSVDHAGSKFAITSVKIILVLKIPG